MSKTALSEPMKERWRTAGRFADVLEAEVKARTHPLYRARGIVVQFVSSLPGFGGAIVAGGEACGRGQTTPCRAAFDSDCQRRGTVVGREYAEPEDLTRCLERLNVLLDETIAGTHLTRRELLSGLRDPYHEYKRAQLLAEARRRTV